MPTVTSKGGTNYMNSIRKYVVSTTLKEPLEWNNSVLVKSWQRYAGANAHAA
jgi:hypothetical protein